jgi:hypothetical protein
LNPVVPVKTGIVLATIARFRRLFNTSLTDGWKVFVHTSNTLDCCCGGKLDGLLGEWGCTCGANSRRRGEDLCQPGRPLFQWPV